MHSKASSTESKATRTSHPKKRRIRERPIPCQTGCIQIQMRRNKIDEEVFLSVQRPRNGWRIPNISCSQVMCLNESILQEAIGHNIQTMYMQIQYLIILWIRMESNQMLRVKHSLTQSWTCMKEQPGMKLASDESEVTSDEARRTRSSTRWMRRTQSPNANAGQPDSESLRRKASLTMSLTRTPRKSKSPTQHLRHEPSMRTTSLASVTEMKVATSSS